MVKHVGDKWLLYTKDGSKVLGTHDTKAEAEAQERAIEASKHRNAEEPRFLTLVNATGVVRREMHDGREHVVVPVVALVEGVITAVNAPSPELVRAAEFADCSGWEGMPVHAGHPMRDGQPISGRLPETLPMAIGMVRNPRVDTERLLMEAWLDPARCASGAGQRILANVTSVPPKMVEVSVGVFTNTVSNVGIWKNGKRYAAEWRGMRKDHLALLDDGKRGACSVEMGCGTPRVAMRVAEDGQLEVLLGDGSNQHQIRYSGPGGTYEVRADPNDMHSVYKDGTKVSSHTTSDKAHAQADAYSKAQHMKSLGARVLEFFRSAMPRGWSDVEVRSELRDALMALEPGMANGEIVSWTDNRVVYCIYPPPPAYPSNGPYGEMKYYARDYTFEGAATEAKVVFGDREEVEPTMTYPRVAAAGIVQDKQEPTPTPCSCGNHAARAAGDNTMTKAERIAALVANPHSPVKSLKMLEAATDEEITALEATATTLKTAAEAATPIPPTPPTPVSVPKSTPATMPTQVPTPKAEDVVSVQETEEQMLARMPGTKAIVDSYKAAQAAEKKTLVTSIRAASQVFTEEQLNAKEVPELKLLAEMAKVEAPKPVVDYSGRGAPRIAAGAELDRFKPVDPWASLNPKVN